MAELKIELNSSGIQAFLKSSDVQSMLKSRASEIRQRCGSGYEVQTYTGKTRATASVVTTTQDAMQDNLDHNTLLKALK